MNWLCKYITTVLVAGLSLLIITGTHAQELRTYNVTCDPDSFQYIVSNPYEDIYIDCAFEYDGVAWDDSRIRLRGNTSRTYPKKSFKVNFDGDNPFLGRDKINLISEYTDPSFSREYLAYELYHYAGLIACQTWFARLYVNGDYLGLYLDVEQVDENFLAQTSLPDDASVYKASEYGTLLSPEESLEELWKKETNTATGFYDLENLIEWLALTPDDQFYDGLGNLFPVTELARVIAVNSMIGNQSTYYHNYYLVHDLSENGLWRMIPWDMDKTFIYGYNSNYFRSGHQMFNTLNALISRCWIDAGMRSLIFQQFDTVMDSFFYESHYQSLTDSLIGLLYDAVQEDTLKQFTTEDFVSTLSALPTLVTDRREELDLKVNTYPLPFTIDPAVVTPDGVYFTWNESSVMDSSEIEYEICLAEDFLFSTVVVELPGLTGSTFLYNQLEPGCYYWRIYAKALPGGGTTRSLNFFRTFTVDTNSFNGTEITGVIDSSVVWTSENSPYLLPDGLIVTPGALLTIDPGVVVSLGPGRSLIIFGGLSADGSEVDSVRFSSIDPAQPWGALIFENSNQPSVLKYVSVTGGTGDPAGPQPDAMIQIAAAQLNAENSSFSGGSQNAISALNADLHFENNRFEQFRQGLLCAQGGNLILRNCTFAFGDLDQSGNALVALDDIDSGLEITACDFNGGTGNALLITGVSGGEISANEIRGAAASGIFLGGNNYGINFANNLIIDNSTGISISDESDVSFYNNAVLFNTIGISMLNSPAGSEISSARNLVIWENGTEIELEPGTQINIAYSLIQGETVYPGTGNINSEPRFLDLWNENFLPEFDSPLIDAGYGSGCSPLDLAGNPRIDVPGVPNTGGGEITFVDIGLFEFDPGIYAAAWLFINEFMADNDNVLPDPQGEYDDWIEIWNGGNQAVNLSGLHLTDDLAEPDKWEFPDTTLPAGGFIIVWADDDEGFPGIHTNFKLSAGGEEIGLFGDQAAGMMLFDSVTFAEQPQDISCGRSPDGAALWQLFSQPTPGFFNLSDSLPPGALTGILQPGIYMAGGDIFVPQNDSLIIEPGVSLVFAGDFSFEIDGFLSAAGNENDSINFILKSGISAWSGIKFNGSASDDSRMEFCNVTGAAAAENWPDNCGGGISIWSASPLISRCTVSGNLSVGNGGGIFCGQNSAPRIEYCLITGNEALGNGGGIYIHSSHPQVINCTVSGNSAAQSGGGFSCNSSNAVITNSIISDNDGQGGLHLQSGWNGYISYNDFHGNQYAPFSGTVPINLGEISGFNVNSHPCDDFQNIFLNPAFQSTTGDSAYRLTEISPCIDAGDPNSPPDPDDTPADMGARYYHHLSFILDPIENLSASVEGTDIRLQWEQVPAANYYVVYRSPEPYFEPGSGTFLTETGTTDYIDPGAAVMPGGLFYQVVYVVVIDGNDKSVQGELLK